MRSRGHDQAVADISATDQVRLHGGKLHPLPGTAAEARLIASLFEHAQTEEARSPVLVASPVRENAGRQVVTPGPEASEAAANVTLLLGEDATIARLGATVRGTRYLHLATHGLTGSADRPYDASLALTQPQMPSPDDIGFLTLDHLIRHWQGRLRGCELVVLSACNTQRGVKAGDSVMALPWGFMYAGAPTVVASLWKVDDTATALLMIRFYKNLLGTFDEERAAPNERYAAGEAMPKAEALREAKLWLRGLSAKEVRDLCTTYELSAPTSTTRGETGPMRDTQRAPGIRTLTHTTGPPSS